MTYVEGFVTPVPTANKAEYEKHAREAAAIIKDNGATRFVECWGDDVPHGKLNDLYTAVDAKEGESVLFSWFEYPDKKTRDAANEKMMSEPRMEEMGANMPFDGKRMIFGGFEALNVAGKNGSIGYIDGVVVPVPSSGKEDYKAWCTKVADIFIEQGASRVVDTWGDDVPEGKHTDFKRAAHLKDDETVAYGWVEWPSKQVRDSAWEKLMQDERLNGGERIMDGKRMMFGGFTPLLDL